MAGVSLTGEGYTAHAGVGRDYLVCGLVGICCCVSLPWLRRGALNGGNIQLWILHEDPAVIRYFGHDEGEGDVEWRLVLGKPNCQRPAAHGDALILVGQFGSIDARNGELRGVQPGGLELQHHVEKAALQKVLAHFG